MEAIAKRAHFFRRASFGATWEELQSSVSEREFLERWLSAQPVVNLPNLGAIERGKDKRNQGLEFSNWLLTQLVGATNPLHERITNFWRDRFVVASNKVGPPHLLLDYESRLRTYALGDFQDLLWQMTISPAMLRYLDNGQNQAGKINENFSREVMELFTIGRGQYTEQDIQQGARALTGWIVKTDRQTGQISSAFVPKRHDNGLKNYLGRQGNFKAEDVVEILANHPSTARNLASSLWSMFVYPNPEASVIQRLATVYQSQKRNIRALVEAIFASPEFYSAKAYRAHLKTPLYFMIGSLRQLQIRADSNKVLSSLRAMGQVPYNAPTVKGWPQDSGWLTAPSLLTRLNLSRQLVQDYGDDGGYGFDISKFQKADLIALLLDGEADDRLRQAVQDLPIRDATALILSAPMYQLA